jgi:membrane protein CcdC involved in cytochrome C biogenesis
MVISGWMSMTSAILGFLVVMTWRIQEGRTAVTLRKIIIPPLGMATGFSMFAVPAFRVPPSWAAGAFLIGALVLAYPLVRTSRLAFQGDTVMVHRSNGFFAVMAGLALIRILGHSYLNTLISVQQTAALFFVLAFGMVLRWRMSMFFEYRRLTGGQIAMIA